MFKVLKVLVLLGILALLFVIATNIWVVASTRNRVITSDEVEKETLALVLGTSKRTAKGAANPFFVERMNTAALLHSQKKIDHILVSGDNGSKYYNEPMDMLKALGDLNIPKQDITLDYAGFRTFDSIVRAKEVFQQDDILIVTQRFHCYRALFISDHFSIEARAVTADSDRAIGGYLLTREILARTLAVIDLYILDRKPKYLGEKENLSDGS